MPFFTTFEQAMIDIENVLVLDLETVPLASDFNSLDSRWQALWAKKASRIAPEQTAEEAYSKAGIYAEFGKIICIGIGVYYYAGNNLALKIKSFEHKDEKLLLAQFTDFLEKHFNKPSHYLAAHNGKEFDYPFLCRRMMINGIKIPTILNLSGKKPWEVQHLDTMELWKQGDYKSYTSLELLAACFDIETPKDDIDGSQVGGIYWKEGDLDRIAHYCKKDVLTTAQILVKIMLNTKIASNNVEIT